MDGTSPASRHLSRKSDAAGASAGRPVANAVVSSAGGLGDKTYRFQVFGRTVNGKGEMKDCAIF